MLLIYNIIQEPEKETLKNMKNVSWGYVKKCTMEIVSAPLYINRGTDSAWAMMFCKSVPV